MSKIVQLKKKGFNEYPITIPEAVIDSKGVTVKDEIKRLERKINNLTPGESSSATPDWNAQEGEAGYIKNKPFEYGYSYKEDINTEFAGTDNTQSFFIFSEEDVYKNFTLRYNGELYYNDEGTGDTYKIRDISGSILVNKFYETFSDSNFSVECFYTDSEPGYYIGVTSLDGLNDWRYEVRNANIEIIFDEKIVKINDKYIPNTVLKTTPQTFSDEDKNQVKENLGLGDVATKSELTEKQDKLVDGQNIKTINGQSIVGSGNIVIEGGGEGGYVTPDWNAEEGKKGFIKNRTHYYNEKLQYRGEIEASINNVATYQLSVYEYIDGLNKAPDKIKFTGGGTSFTLDFIKEPIPGYNHEEDVQEMVLKRFTIDSNNDIEVRYYYNGNPEYYEGVIIELELIATNYGYQEYITFTTEDYYVDLKQIDDIFIPNTIARKSNIPDIDPVVWKYMMNPFIIYTEQDNSVPDDLLSIIDDNGSLNLNPLILKLIVVKYEGEGSTLWNINKVESDGVCYATSESKISYSDGVFIWS